MKKTLQDIHMTCNELILISFDNMISISISKNPIMHSKTKYIPIKFHFLREQVTEKNIKLEYIGTKEQVEYIFTKPLPRETFEYLREKLGVIFTPNWIHLSSTRLQYDKWSMAEVPFSIDAKGEEKNEQGR